jgi:hypothetical protein
MGKTSLIWPFLVRILSGRPESQKSPIRPTERLHICTLGPKPDGVSPIQEPGHFVHTHSPFKAEIGHFGAVQATQPIGLRSFLDLEYDVTPRSEKQSQQPNAGDRFSFQGVILSVVLSFAIVKPTIKSKSCSRPRPFISVPCRCREVARTMLTRRNDMGLALG